MHQHDQRFPRLGVRPEVHAFLGFVGVTTSGQQNWPAEIIRKTGIVTAIGQKP